MFYAVIGITKSIFTDYAKVQRARILNPLATVKAFNRYKDAENYLNNTRKYVFIPKKISKFGKKMSPYYCTVDYIIGERGVYYNIDFRNIGNVGIHTEDKHAHIFNRGNLTNLFIDGISLNPCLIKSHLIAIIIILDMIGPFIDVEVILPSTSIFLAIEKYTGTRRDILKLIDKIKERKNNISFTIRRYYHEEKD